MHYYYFTNALEHHKIKIVEFANSIDPDKAAHQELPYPGSTLFALLFLKSQYDIAWIKHFSKLFRCTFVV